MKITAEAEKEEKKNLTEHLRMKRYSIPNAFQFAEFNQQL